MADEKKIEVKRDGDKNAILPFKALTESLAEQFGVTPAELIETTKVVCFKDGAASNAQLMMLLSFTKNFGLNPLAKECYAFISQGRMSVGVQVDGWSKIADRREDYDGQEIIYENAPNGDVIAITSKTYVKGRAHPTVYRAVLKEWKRNTDVWNSMPTHQLYVKARNEGIRFAFGIPAYDPDDIERIERSHTAIETTATVVAGASVNSDGAGTAHSPQGSTTADADRTDTGKSADAAPASTVETSAVAPPVAENAAAGNAQHNESSPAPAAAAPPPAEPSKPKGGIDFHKAHEAGLAAAKAAAPAGARKKLDKLIAEHVTSARLNLMLGQAGAASVDALSDEQVAAMIAKIESRKGK